ncbi:stage II sporulation protein [Thermosipho melanesiensis]|uniref:Stage II sporulation E family protein n=2 Tax=Thermosipho melanesiensis TaxID=46541 RepID=A6LKA9_THEM4|nr:SpoIIE family protein phosphatase [Thermosipho melanesiensis]ABR30360.1 Stage II sporulation E family protein [Thermosipho melanesiensis BI429]APT73526.1 stage II sporulation protein [Thermosipho melanesiensis]OOC37476.1 stage II sporulation protein [Thermosipho melanesiensis]OOC39681.1 stage II sporulation protein [Thermosipho melanesiensis]OOC39709.1 stage II sporulation protein [Thermosipho melanesiensis]
MITCEINYAFKNKGGEWVCGDSINIKRNEEKCVVSVSDGLGSGVKANILSTLTSTMSTTMVFNNVSIEEVFSSILSTLPTCKVRRISYSTLATCLIDYKKKRCTIFEYEFPLIFYFKNDDLIPLKKVKKSVSNKYLYVSEMDINVGDSIFLMTDGISQAGMGSEKFPFGFGEENIRFELRNLIKNKVEHVNIVEHMIKLAKKLDKGTKGDDALIAGLKIREKRILTIMVGPPEQEEKDKEVVEKLINSKGKKVICGGTTGQIVERVTGKKIDIDVRSISKISPPVGYMEGIDLVTEGIITLTQVFRYYENQIEEMGVGAKKIIDLLDWADVINFLVGRAINPAHQNPLFTHDISLKFRLIHDIAKILEEKGKIINIEYF